MKYVIGLGNKGDSYASTRHNVGFLVIDKYVSNLEKANVKTKNSDAAYILETGDKAKLIKPMRLMNNSGQVLRDILPKQLEGTNIMVIHDDVDLPLGTIRIKLGGSSAGHKGIESIINAIGANFWRMRIGIGRPTHTDTKTFVLEAFTKKEKALFEKVLGRAAQLTDQYINSNLESTETIYVS